MPQVKENPTALEQLRRSQGLTQKELAYLSDISLDTIKAFEVRRRNINLIALNKALSLAEALHCDVRDFMEKEEA